MEWLLIAALTFFAIFGIASIMGNNNRKQIVQKNLQEIEDFSPSQTVIKIEAVSSILRGVSFDIERQKVVFVTDEKTFSLKDFKGIISCEIIIDGETVTQTSRTNLLAGAALGGAVFGGAGAIVGAMISGNKTVSKPITKNVSVRFLINDLRMPSYELSYIELTHTGSTLPQVAKIEAQSLYDFVRVIIHQQNNQYNQ